MVESVTNSHCDILDFNIADFYVLYISSLNSTYWSVKILITHMYKFSFYLLYFVKCCCSGVGVAAHNSFRS